MKMLMFKNKKPLYYSAFLFLFGLLSLFVYLNINEVIVFDRFKAAILIDNYYTFFLHNAVYLVRSTD